MISGYPKTARLQTGTAVTIRPMVKEDAGKLHGFFARVPREDRLFLREDVSRRDVIDAWARELDYENVLPLLAEIGENIIGDATLHRRKGGWASHTGKVRIVIDKEYRGKGLGTLLLEELSAIAKQADLELLIAEVMATQTSALALFRSMGFEKEAVLYNYVKDQAGKKHSLILLVKDLLAVPVPAVF